MGAVLELDELLGELPTFVDELLAGCRPRREGARRGERMRAYDFGFQASLSEDVAEVLSPVVGADGVCSGGGGGVFRIKHAFVVELLQDVVLQDIGRGLLSKLALLVLLWGGNNGGGVVKAKRVNKRKGIGGRAAKSRGGWWRLERVNRRRDRKFDAHVI